MTNRREPWHYDATKGRPDWSKELGRRRVIEKQIANDLKAKRERNAA